MFRTYISLKDFTSWAQGTRSFSGTEKIALVKLVTKYQSDINSFLNISKHYMCLQRYEDGVLGICIRKFAKKPGQQIQSLDGSVRVWPADGCQKARGQTQGTAESQGGVPSQSN